MQVHSPARRPISMSVSSRSPTISASSADTPAWWAISSPDHCGGLADEERLALRRGGDRRHDAAAAGDHVSLHRVGGVAVGGDELRPAEHCLLRLEQLAIGELPVHAHHHIVDGPLPGPPHHSQPRRLQLRRQPPLANHEHRGFRLAVERPDIAEVTAGQGGGGDDMLGIGLDSEAREQVDVALPAAGGVIREVVGLVPALPEPFRGLLRAGDGGLPPIDHSIEVEDHNPNTRHISVHRRVGPQCNLVGSGRAKANAPGRRVDRGRLFTRPIHPITRPGRCQGQSERGRDYKLWVNRPPKVVIPSDSPTPRAALPQAERTETGSESRPRKRPRPTSCSLVAMRRIAAGLPAGRVAGERRNLPALQRRGELCEGSRPAEPTGGRRLPRRSRPSLPSVARSPVATAMAVPRQSRDGGPSGLATEGLATPTADSVRPAPLRRV